MSLIPFIRSLQQLGILFSKSTLPILLGFLGYIVSGSAQSPFVTTWQTDNPGVTNDNQIQIPGTGSNYSITWEEVGNSGNNGSLLGNGTTIVTFPVPGAYYVSITPSGGSFSSIRFDYSGDNKKIINIDSWGSINWNSFERSFSGCTNLHCNASDLPNLNNVSKMDYMFGSCYELNGPQNINDWDVSNVTSLLSMFSYSSKFNQPLGNWNVSNVKTMREMFWEAHAFNQDISNWNVGNVTSMFLMFTRAYVYIPIGLTPLFRKALTPLFRRFDPPKCG